jgi:hypothetical protein
VNQPNGPVVPPGPAEGAKALIDAAVEDDARTRRRRADAEGTASKPKSPPAALIALLVALPVLGILYATNIKGLSLADLFTPAPTPAVARQQAEQAVHLVVREIESFKKDYSELPYSLTEVGTPVDGDWSYTKTPGNQYQIALRFYGQVVTFDSRRAEPAPILK